MKYYKVQQEHNYWNKYGKHLGCVIKDELITPYEMKKHGFPIDNNFMPIEINKNKTFWCFGCRFEIEE